MGLIDRIKLGKHVKVLTGANNFAERNVQTAMTALQADVPAAIGLICDSAHKFISLSVMTEALERMISDNNLNLFAEGMQSPDQRVVEAVSTALQRSAAFSPSRLLDWYNHPDMPTKALTNIIYIHRDKLSALELLRFLPRIGGEQHEIVLRLIVQKADKTLVPEIIARAYGKDARMRVQMAKLMHRFAGQDVVDALQNLLKDSSKLVKIAALESLARVKWDVDISLLVKKLMDNDVEVQAAAIEALTLRNDPSTIKHLMPLLGHDSEYLRRAAVEVLNEVGNTESIKDLLLALEDKDWWVKVRAADALSKIGGDIVVDAMLELVRDENEFIRRTAVEILNSQGSPRAYKSLIEALSDEDWWVKERAIDALGMLRDKRAVSHLLPLLDGDERAKPVVLKALGEIGDKAVLEPILQRFHDFQGAARKAAIQTLDKLADEASASRIHSVLNGMGSSDDTDVKELAETTLATMIDRFGVVAEGHIHAPEQTRVSPDKTMVSSDDMVQKIDTDELKPGHVFAGRYLYERKIGEGSFGIVLLAKDQMVGDEMVMKFMHSALARNETNVKRFTAELRNARKITHQNVIRIFDIMNFGKSIAITMEYFPSHPLNELIKKKHFKTFDQMRQILLQIANGMEAAHQVGVVHRDLKPANILVGAGEFVKVVDFGVSAALDSDASRVTQTGFAVGTPTYMSPEQAQGPRVDNRSDVYALGIIMYEMFTGQVPYKGETPVQVLFQHVEGKVTPPRDLNKNISPELEALILKAMAIKPNDRYQSMGELRQALTALAL